MRALETALPPGDGVGWFNRLYLAVTEAVDEKVRGGEFEDARFLTRLDVVFANLYLRALRDYTRRSSRLAPAWEPLVEARRRRGIAPLQFALAGMNAHINRDLPVALVETWEALGLEPATARRQHDDFERVNAVLEATEERVKEWFAVGLAGHVDRTLGRHDDILAMWKVRRAREAAWTNGETLWALRGLPHVRSQFLLALDRMVGFAGRGLLLPLDGRA